MTLIESIRRLYRRDPETLRAFERLPVDEQERLAQLVVNNFGRQDRWLGVLSCVYRELRYRIHLAVTEAVR